MKLKTIFENILCDQDKELLPYTKAMKDKLLILERRHSLARKNKTKCKSEVLICFEKLDQV